jgi:HAMP domain-containing protein
MKIRSTIALRIGLGFGILIIAVILIIVFGYKKYGNNQLIFLLTIVFAGILIAIFLISSLVKPIKKFKKTLNELANGELPEINLPERSDEIGQMATAINSLLKNLKILSNFSQEIGKGNYLSEFKPLSDKDILGNSLLRMREDLKNAALEDEKRKQEDERRNWSTQGIARFSEILREYSGDFNELSFQIISNLVKYIGANVGGLFLVYFDNTEKKYLELVASYAFDRKKYMKKQVLLGEGLAGRAFQEGETILLTDIPEDYINITSGLGEDKPRNLLIVPLKVNEEIHGVVELASLREILPYQIEFTERICNNIASSLSTLRLSSKDTLLSPLSVILSGDILEVEDRIEQEIKNINFIREQLTNREKELINRIPDKQIGNKK